VENYRDDNSVRGFVVTTKKRSDCRDGYFREELLKDYNGFSRHQLKWRIQSTFVTMQRNATTPKKSKTSQKKKTKTAKQKKQQQEYSKEETEWTDDLIEETALVSFQKGMAKFIKSTSTF
jgi:hypothetical protein